MAQTFFGFFEKLYDNICQKRLLNVQKKRFFKLFLENLLEVLLWSRRFQFFGSQGKILRSVINRKNIKLNFLEENDRMIHLGTHNADLTTIV